MRPLAALVALCWLSSQTAAQAVKVRNPSFEEGRGAPEGWELAQGRGAWEKRGACAGKRAVLAEGEGEDSSYWRSAPLDMRPSALYILDFRARRVSGSGGTPITGPIFCNRDLGAISGDWQPYRSVFFTPRVFDEGNNALRFGQWHMNGAVAYDSVRLAEAVPVYRRQEGMEMGLGERLDGKLYTFAAPFDTVSRNHSRALMFHRCGFNTNRWVFGAESEVVYNHLLGDRHQEEASIEVNIPYHQAGELVVETQVIGSKWREIGQAEGRGNFSFSVPRELLPARSVWIRLSSRASAKLGADSDPGSFQVGSYVYRARVSGPAASLTGDTRYAALLERDAKIRIHIQDLGESRPGGRNVLTLGLLNPGSRAVPARPSVRLEKNGRISERRLPMQLLRPVPSPSLFRGYQEIAIPYEVDEMGDYTLHVSLSGGLEYALEYSFSVPCLEDATYGSLLPGSGPAADLWWASSGWKVSKRRPAPARAAAGMLIRAAANEAEAAQLVVRPREKLSKATVQCSDLKGPDGASIPSSRVDILRVGYVEVKHPTDDAGVPGLWPDPLPPAGEPRDLPAGENSPFWIRVRIPPDARAGEYRGTLAVSAEGYRAEAPLRVEVYGFSLPQRMSLTTAFGFSPGNVWRYHSLTDPVERREVLDRYLQNLAAHHISPYNPAPLDPFGVTWPGAGNWSGGKWDREVRKSGTASLRVDDWSSSAQPAARLASPLAVMPGGVRLGFRYRTHLPGHRFLVSVSHYDRGGEWLRGRNLDFELEGDGNWQAFDQTIAEFPKEAAAFDLRLYASLWQDDGSPTGTVWFDDLELAEAASGDPLMRKEDFDPVSPDGLIPEFGWEEWDGAMERAFGRYGFNSFAVPVQGMGGGTFHSRTEPSLLGFSEDSPEYRQAFSAYCSGVESHLREKGWLPFAFVYWFDEPDPKDYAFVMNGFGKLERAAPGLGRMLTEQIEPALVGGPNIWCPVSPAHDQKLARKRQKKGERVWWYICTVPKAPYAGEFIDHAGTEMRVWLWQTWQRGLEGILIWQTNYWTSDIAYPDAPQNPYEDPMSWVTGYGTPAGTREPWGNGDGRFIYPPEAAADGSPAEPVLAGPVDSLRWEMLRDGIEDYEYMAMLREKLKEKKGKLPRRQRRAYAELLEVPPSITSSMTEFTLAPEPLEARRHAIAKALESLAAL